MRPGAIQPSVGRAPAHHPIQTSKHALCDVSDVEAVQLGQFGAARQYPATRWRETRTRRGKADAVVAVFGSDRKHASIEGLAQASGIHRVATITRPVVDHQHPIGRERNDWPTT